MIRRPHEKVAGILLAMTAACLIGSGQVRTQERTAGNDKPSVIYGENDEIPEALRRNAFVLAWETIRDDYFDPTFGGKDWEGIKEKYLHRIAETRTSGPFHKLLGSMVAELGRSHLTVIAPHQMQAGMKTDPEARMTPEGLELGIVEGRFAIVSVKPDSPAWAAGLRPGFILTKAGDTPLPGPEEVKSSSLKALASARRALSGAAGTSAILSVLDEKDGEKAVSISRTAVFQERANLGRSIFESYRIHPRVGYIRFDGWAFDLPPKLQAALKDLRDSDGLIIDCRQNRGGVNPGVDYLASVLCEEAGLLAVETRRNGERREWTHAGAGAGVYRGRLAVLIDEGSGSASEVFAGAMQEKGRAVILGRTSYGGVFNSTQVRLPTGGVLQYPHSDMRTPKGKRIEGCGVIPDIPVERTRADLLKGKDTVMERAVSVILGG